MKYIIYAINDVTTLEEILNIKNPKGEFKYSLKCGMFNHRISQSEALELNITRDKDITWCK